MPEQETKIIWEPQPKQLLLMQCPAAETFFGGAKGGGKTDGMLGDFIAHANRYGESATGIFMRRSYSELEDVIARSHIIYGKIGASYKISDKTWTFPNGATLRLRHLERDTDAMKYQGHCVELGTLIDTPLGLVKIEDLKIGDLVETLEGPKAVTEIHGTQNIECVESDGIVFPVTHPVLTSLGWQSYASLLDNDSKESVETSRGLQQNLSVSASVRLAKLPHFSLLYSKKSILSQIFCKYYQLLNLAKGNLRSSFLGLQQVVSKVVILTSIFRKNGILNALLVTEKALSLIKRYSSYLSRYDEQLLTQIKIYQDQLHKLHDAVKPFHVSYKQDDQDSIQEHIPDPLFEYVHPYSGEVRKEVRYYSHYKTLSFTPIGIRSVMDITVADVNHYITANGMCHKNSYSWICIDELGNYPTPYVYNQMLSCLRSATKDVVCQMRSSGNPGGVGHGWVKRRFIDGKIPDRIYSYKVVIPDGDGGTREVEFTRCFIPSKVSDNKILMKNDPMYVARLHQLPDYLKKAFLYGDWNVFVGQVFGELNKNHYMEPMLIPYDWEVFATMDWGFSNPYSVGFWAMTSEGRLIRIWEEYGCVPGMENTGVKLGALEVARRLVPKLNGMGITKVYADPAVWQQHGHAGNLSIAALWAKGGVPLIPGKRDRKASLAVIHTMMQQTLDDGLPMLRIFNTCKEWIRTVPNLVGSKNDIEDVDTNGEDHIYDEMRYAVMSPIVQNGSRNWLGETVSKHRYVEEDRDYAL